ncbi:SDR family oxidoreductase [Demequina rhizosphaerae]|uniref:SDR family oxidoreductase n=1 Tax=Demequina rhizosphaerae TaxID=1638985 RepID=UPI0007854184|nr:SDR family oxidoreductase [Demequina rhizosphaerae]
MARTYVITGAASGIGKATAEMLEGRGHTVVGIDLHGADIEADLTTADGRGGLADAVREKAPDGIDAVVAVAGLAHPVPATVAVNYFGMVATLENLRPLLLGSPAPRAAGVASMASLQPNDPELVEAMLAGDEPRSLARAEVLAADEQTGQLIYGSTKAAFARWIRRNAAAPDWAGASIPLNAVAPGIIRTPMTEGMIATEEAAQELLKIVPMPLNGIAEPAVVAHLLAWLTSEENSHLCGQVVFVDGGSDVVIRGDSVW